MTSPRDRNRSRHQHRPRAVAATLGRRDPGRVGLSALTWAALAALASLLIAATALGHGGERPEGDTMKHPGHTTTTVAVSGDAELRVDPDLATVSLGVTAQAEDAGEAQAQVNRTASAILQAVRDLEIEEDAVQTSRLSLSPVYDNRRPREGQMEPQEPRIVGYRASNVVSVRLDDLTKVGPVIDATVKAGANQVQGVSFSLEDDADTRMKALGQAVEAAKAKAETVAEALGMKLGRALQVEESGISMERPQMAYQEMAMRVSNSGGAQVSSGQVAVNARVEVRYELVP